MDRRRFLATAGAIAAASTSGCLGGNVPSGLIPPKDRGVALPASGTAAAQEQPADVMGEKVNQAAQTLQRTGQGTEVYEAAITEGLEGLFLSNLAVLPTQGVEETETLFAEWLSHEDTFESALDIHISDVGTSQSKSTALGGRNFLQVTTEAMQVIGEQTKACDPANPEQCNQISQEDDPQAGNENTQQVQSATVIDVSQFEGFAREVRAPFFLGWNVFGTRRTPSEEVIETEDLWPGECQGVLKETKGVKVVVRPVRVPIWVEPWRARRRIVGTRLIWIWEFVPAEFIKTISVCNENGKLNRTVDMEIVLEPGLTHFWRYVHQG